MHERLTHCPMGDEIDWITPNIGVCSHKIMCFTSEGLATDWPFPLSGFPYEIVEGLISAVRAERLANRELFDRLGIAISDMDGLKSQLKRYKHAWTDEKASANDNAIALIEGHRELIETQRMCCILSAIAEDQITIARAAEILGQHPDEYRRQVHDWATEGVRMAEEAP